MSGKQSRFREFVRELIPHAAWDGIRTLIVLGAAIGLTATSALLQWIRDHLDIVIIVIAFLASVLILVVAMLLADRRNRSDSSKSIADKPWTLRFLLLDPTGTAPSDRSNMLALVEQHPGAIVVRADEAVRH